MKEFNDYLFDIHYEIPTPEKSKINFEKTVHLGTKLGKFLAYLEAYVWEVKDWKNYYNDDDILKGVEISDLEKEYSLKTINDIEDYFNELFENYFTSQENNDS
jgi:hypothetical protein